MSAAFRWMATNARWCAALCGFLLLSLGAGMFHPGAGIVTAGALLYLAANVGQGRRTP